MSRRGRGRNRNKAGAPTQESTKKPANRARKNEPRIDPVEFWGDRSSLPEPITSIEPRREGGGAIPRSGADHGGRPWFSLVYERAAVLGARGGWWPPRCRRRGRDARATLRYGSNRNAGGVQSTGMAPTRAPRARRHRDIRLGLRPGSVGGGCAARPCGARRRGRRFETCRPTPTTPSPCSGCRTPASRSVLRRAVSTLTRRQPGPRSRSSFTGCGAGLLEPFVDVGPGDYFADAVAWMAAWRHPGTSPPTTAPIATSHGARWRRSFIAWPASLSMALKRSPTWTLRTSSPLASRDGERRITTGTSATTFSPDRAVTRAERPRFYIASQASRASTSSRPVSARLMRSLRSCPPKPTPLCSSTISALRLVLDRFRQRLSSTSSPERGRSRCTPPVSSRTAVVPTARTLRGGAGSLRAQTRLRRSCTHSGFHPRGTSPT